MRVLIYTDQQAREWRAMLAAGGHDVTTLPLGTPPISLDIDVCIVLNLNPGDLFAHRAWLAKLTTPTLLITTALAPAQALCRSVPALRLICHPSRAAHHLGELLHMACEVRAGAMVLGPKLGTGSLRRFTGASATR